MEGLDVEGRKEEKGGMGEEGTEEEGMMEEGTVEYVIISGPKFTSDEEKLFATKFPPSGGGDEDESMEMTKEQGNLSLGKWKIVNGLRKHNIEDAGTQQNQTQTISKHGGVSLSTRQSMYFHNDKRALQTNVSGWSQAANFTLQEVTSDIVGSGATMIAQRQLPMGGSKYFMLYVDEECAQGTTTFFARKVDDMYNCNALYTKPLDSSGDLLETGSKSKMNDENGSKTENDSGLDNMGKPSDLKKLVLALREKGKAWKREGNKQGAETDIEDRVKKGSANLRKATVGKLPLGYGDDDWEYDSANSNDDVEVGYRIDGDGPDEANEDMQFEWDKTVEEIQKTERAIKEDILDIDYIDETDNDNDEEKDGDISELPANKQHSHGKEEDNKTTAHAGPSHSVGIKRERDETNEANDSRKKVSMTSGIVQTSHNVSAEDIRSLLRDNGGSMSSKELSKAFKGRLLTKKDKQDFATLVKTVAKKTSNEAGTMITLK